MSKMYKRNMSFKTRMPHACGLARALGARPRDACRLTHRAVERSSAAQVDAHAARPRSRVAVHIRDALTAESALVFSRFWECAVFLNSVTGVKIDSRKCMPRNVLYQDWKEKNLRNMRNSLGQRQKRC